MENSKLIMRVCGQFSVPDTSRLHSLASRREAFPAGTVAEYRRYYYDDVVDFTFSRCVTYSLLDAPVEGDLCCGANTAHIVVDGVKARLMPYGVMVFWLELSCQAEDLNVFTALGTTIRNCALLDSLLTDSALLRKVFEPVFALYRTATGEEAGSITRLMQYGNKFKLFQVVEIPGETYRDIPADILLYQLATVMRVTPLSAGDPQGMSLSYLRREVRRNMLCVFNNWRAMALFDTFTLLSMGERPDYILQSWLDDYFGVIYLYNIFHKYYLQSLNRRFHKPGANARALADELDDFRCGCRFNKISYNFLPNDINRIIDAALDIQDERDSLHQLVHQEGRRQEERNATRLNNVLTFLTVLTIFSTLTDSVSLFWQLVRSPGDISVTLMYSRLVASLLVAVVLVVAVLLLRKRVK